MPSSGAPNERHSTGLVVGYSLGVPTVKSNVSIRGWGVTRAGGSASDVLEVATVRVTDNRAGDPAAGPANCCLTYEDIGSGMPAQGDSGAGVFVGGCFFGVFSCGNATGDAAIAVKTSSIAAWIQPVSMVIDLKGRVKVHTWKADAPSGQRMCMKSYAGDANV